MIDRLRSALFAAMTTPVGDKLTPVRATKNVARRINRTLGSPLGSAAELEKRNAAKAKLTALRRAPQTAASAPTTVVLAPVTVYFEGVRNARMVSRVTELLDAKAIAYKKLDVAEDEATMKFVLHTAGCEADELPIVFVGSACIGGYEALVTADVSGELASKLRGA